MERMAFEQELVAQLGALDEALRAADIDRDQALAAFDTAAWSAWEAPKVPQAPEATFVPRTVQPIRALRLAFRGWRQSLWS